LDLANLEQVSEPVASNARWLIIDQIHLILFIIIPLWVLEQSLALLLESEELLPLLPFLTQYFLPLFKLGQPLLI
jgi:hypothetical protein